MSNSGFLFLAFLYNKVTKMFIIKISFETNSVSNCWNQLFALTREGRYGRCPGDVPWGGEQSPWWTEPSGQSWGLHLEKGCWPAALLNAHTWQLGWCIPHAALEFSQLMHQIFHLEGEGKKIKMKYNRHMVQLWIKCHEKKNHIKIALFTLRKWFVHFAMYRL